MPPALEILQIQLAQDDFQPFLGEDFFAWMILAFGAAMVVGNVAALVRAPADEGDAAQRPPLARVILLTVVGLAAAGWGLASLLA